MIDSASNLIEPSQVVLPFGAVSFVPSQTGGSTNVLSFPGDKDSLVLMGNSGVLAVTSFTFTAMVFPEDNMDGPIFNFYSSDPVNDYYGIHIWIIGSRLYLGVCEKNTAPLATMTSSEALVQSQWNYVGVAYDAGTSDAEMYVNGFLESQAMGVSVVTPMRGVAVMGSRFSYDDPNNQDERAFKGRVACVRLWDVKRNLINVNMNPTECSNI